MYVLGVDGCKGGWLSARLNLTPLALTFGCSSSFAELLNKHRDAECIAIDIPIGLIEGVPRNCDLEARKILKARHSTVFPAPDPRLIDEPDFKAARTKAIEIGCKKLSQQTAAILDKIREVNIALAASDQSGIVEVHPELGFCVLNNGVPVSSSKKYVAGFEERRALLSTRAELTVPDRSSLLALKFPAKPDDFIDATVAAWIGWRHTRGKTVRLPTIPQIGWRDLKAEIVL